MKKGKRTAVFSMLIGIILILISIFIFAHLFKLEEIKNDQEILLEEAIEIGESGLKAQISRDIKDTENLKSIEKLLCFVFIIIGVGLLIFSIIRLKKFRQ